MDRIQKGYYNYQFVPDVLAERLAALRSCIPMRSRLIDLGCNDGTISLALLDSGHALHSTGIDFEDVRDQKPASFDFIATDLRHFDLATLPAVDVVLCLNVIHHLCIHGTDFACDFMAQLAERAGTVICEMGSLTARMEAPWLTALRSRWHSDEECWADLFRPFAWRRPLLTYPFQFGRRVMWKLASDCEPSYTFDVFDKTETAETIVTRLHRTGTHEFFWGKSYKDVRTNPAYTDLRHSLCQFLKHAPYDCNLPLMTHPQYGDLYAFDPELANGRILTLDEALSELSPAEYQYVRRFADQTIPGLHDFPIDMLFDFRVARTSRGLTFLHFEPHPFSLGLLAG